MGGFLSRLWDRRRLQPVLIQSAWSKCIARRRNEAFNTVLIKLCIMDPDMAAILRTSAGHAVNTDEADFVMQQLAGRIAMFFEGLIADGTVNNIEKFNQDCFHLGQQHAGFSKEEFQLTWWDIFVDILMNEFSTASPEEQKAWRNMLELVTVQMKNGYEKAKSNMNQRPSS